MRVGLSVTLALFANGMLTGACNAMVGNAPRAESATARAVVTLVGSRGNFCSGVLLAPDLVLTAAHCVPRGAIYKLVDYSASPPKLLGVKRVALHPQFNAQAIANNRASADVALLQLEEPRAGRTTLPLDAPNALAPGNKFDVIGVGVTIHGDGKSGGAARNAALIATGKPGNLQIRLVDPATQNARDGLGACTGDSGAPVVEDQNGRAVVIGVVSWSTAANNAAGCGGLTGVTPLTLYRDWVVRTAREWGAQISSR